MDNNQNLLNDLIKHFTSEQMKASLEMTKYYEDEYGDDVELDYPNGAIGDPHGMQLETIPSVYGRVIRHLKDLDNRQCPVCLGITGKLIDGAGRSMECKTISCGYEWDF
tara:strand:- start:2505 stop:2831 length:327 start_codon:yes stop_codon:yes gene_type:complete